LLRHFVALHAHRPYSATGLRLPRPGGSHQAVPRHYVLRNVHFTPQADFGSIALNVILRGYPTRYRLSASPGTSTRSENRLPARRLPGGETIEAVVMKSVFRSLPPKVQVVMF
jgi:hypothetical protein